MKESKNTLSNQKKISIIQIQTNRIHGTVIFKKWNETLWVICGGHCRYATATKKTGFLRLFEMAKFWANFVPNSAKVTAPLGNLTRSEVDWFWDQNHEKSCQQLKHLLSNAVLSFVDPKVDLEIETEASKDGLGVCLLQNGQPVAFSSRNLTKSEFNYTQIDKELLAIDFLCQKFHYWIHGMKNVGVNIDHKPLVSIFQEELYNVTLRLQRFRHIY